jgi:Cell division protein FtsI/penicillin-binding protein 2
LPPGWRDFLREAAGEGGTGEQAQLTNYSVLGKTGTAVRFVKAATSTASTPPRSRPSFPRIIRSWSSS